MHRLRVKSRHFQYEIVLARGAWRVLRPLGGARYTATFILTERALWDRWSKKFVEESGLSRARVLFIPPGERSKSFAMAERVSARLLLAGADRRSLLVGFGGGVVGDLAGFVASTYMRGIDLVHVPTTVVAQVDSSIGGKTAVNVGAMKNLAGTFYPPRLVAADPRVLASLGGRAFRSGVYEIVKHGILAGPRFFSALENSLDSLSARNAPSLEKILAEAARVKVEVVNRDEREARLRMVLNLGHTFGHALEEATGYRRFLHGEAVGWGLLGVIRLGERLGLTPAAEARRMAALVRRVGALPAIRDLKPGRVVKLLARDKKSVGARLNWVIPEKIGKIRIVTDVPRDKVAAAFRDLQQAEPHV
jgi:3-dehydroquinate synthase